MKSQTWRTRSNQQLDPFFLLEREAFSLYHDDISRHNLIVDSKGKLQALVDWAFVESMSNSLLYCQLSNEQKGQTLKST